MIADAIRWECARCHVWAGRIDGTRITLPAGWSGSDEGTFCLSCRRALAGDAAIDDAPADSSREDLVRIRRKALIEFELLRMPDAPNRTIANACHTSAATVAAIRGPGPPIMPESARPRASGG